MSFALSILNNNALVEKQALQEILKYNDLTARYGLMLTEQQAVALVETRTFALKENGRIEFGGGVIEKLIYAFCDSPYLTSDHYEETLHNLLEVFYYYKNESLDLISDDDLIRFMKQAFDGVCQGSLELLAGRELDGLARNLRNPNDWEDSDDISQEEEDDDGEY
ncbi:hypothetical protein CLNEO_16640 [Anaerotignum neopropionicum]|uniref:Uncharacterized protein n=1 Tax=Anaerotignum neopropionicum TaxID=36847 RepID=A0A136WF37_9FIRM|nr:DUF6323 family protein [Anaerotignum neopropionicum]KXL53121.1 hypothetical protein CLNEO_16640 [Anaerotignum neopropionicum]